MAIIRLFASVREKIGVDKLEITLNQPNQLRNILLEAADMKGADPVVLANGSLLYAVNLRMVNLDAMVEDGDEIAVLPPMSGGV